MSDTLDSQLLQHQQQADSPNQLTSLSTEQTTLETTPEITTTTEETTTTTSEEEKKKSSISSSSTSSTFVQTDSQGQLPLEYSWDLYHQDPETIERQIQLGIWDPIYISTFSTVRDFWSVFNNIAPPTYLPNGTTLYLFKHGVPPRWESSENKQGGELGMIMDTTKAHNKEQSVLDSYDQVWTNTLLAIIGEYFTDSDEIRGITAVVKFKFTKVSIWLGDSKNEKSIERIKNELITLLHPQFKPDDISFRPFAK